MWAASVSPMDVGEVLQRERKKRQQIAADLQNLQQKLLESDTKIRVLESVVVEYDEIPAETILTMPRTEAILRVMTDEARPLSPEDIRQALNDRGRTDEYNAVSAAIAHLQRTDRVHSVGRGAWVLGAGDFFHEDESVEPTQGQLEDWAAQHEALRDEHDEIEARRARGEIA